MVSVTVSPAGADVRLVVMLPLVYVPTVTVYDVGVGVVGGVVVPVVGVTGPEAADGTLFPLALVAVTVKV